MDDKGKRERSHTDYISTIPAQSILAKTAGSRRVCLLILGMHRSGTSALARVFHILGCDLPKTLMGPSKSNPAGHWESQRIADLNDEILATAGSSWHDWLEFNPGWRRSPKAVEFRERARQILNDEYGSSSFFVLKDPRICRMAPFWLETLEECGIAPLVIFPLRNPLEVSASLEQRNGFNPFFGRLLWLRHVLDAELTSRGLPRFFASYDCLLSGPYRLAAGMEQRLGMSWPRPVANAADEIDNFLSERDHRHHTETPERVLDDPLVPGWLRDTFRILSRWATIGEQDEDFAILDRVRSEFNAAGPAFAQLISASRNAAAKVHTLETSLLDIRTRLHVAEAQLAQRDQKVAELEDVATSTQAELKVRETELDEVRANWAGLSASIKSSHDVLLASTKEQKTAYAELLRSHQDMTQRLAFGAQEILQLTKILEAFRAEAGQARTDAAMLQNIQLELERLKIRYDQLQKAKDAAETAHTETGLKLAKAKDEVASARAELQSLQFEMRQLKENWEQSQRELEAARRANAETSAELRKVWQNTEKAEAERQQLEMRVSEGFEEITILTRMLRDFEALKEEASKARADAELLPRIKDQLDQLKSKHSALQRETSEATYQLQKARTAADTIAADKRQIENQLEERFHEIAALTRLLQKTEKPYRRSRLWLKRTRMAINPLRWSQLKTDLSVEREMSRLRRSGLFDPKWYLMTYPDVASAGIDPLRHYTQYGAAEGRKPNARA